MRGSTVFFSCRESLEAGVVLIWNAQVPAIKPLCTLARAGSADACGRSHLGSVSCMCFFCENGKHNDYIYCNLFILGPHKSDIPTCCWAFPLKSAFLCRQFCIVLLIKLGCMQEATSSRHVQMCSTKNCR